MPQMMPQMQMQPNMSIQPAQFQNFAGAFNPMQAILFFSYYIFL